MNADIEEFLGRKAKSTRYEEHWIAHPDGGKLYAHVHCPDDDGRYRGIVIVPGGLGAGVDYDNGNGITADDFA
jgi:hypothetical protein